MLAETVSDTAAAVDVDIPDPEEIISRLAVEPGGVEDIVGRIEKVANALAGKGSFGSEETPRSEKGDDSTTGADGEQVA